MAAVQNLLGVIAAEVGRGLGAAIQQSSDANPTVGGGSSKDARPYTQDQLATLQGVHGHGALYVQYMKKMWRLFQSVKVPNYDHILRAPQRRDAPVGGQQAILDRRGRLL